MTGFVYDAAGRPYRTVEHRDGSTTTSGAATVHDGDKVTETHYSLAGRVLETLEPGVDNVDDGSSYTWATGTHRVTAYGYDDAGRQVSVTDPANHTTTTGYDDDSRVATVTSPEGRVTTYGYDDAGNQTAVTTPSGFTSGPTTVTRTMSYWPDGAIKTDTDPHVPGGSPDPSTRIFTYTAGGRLSQVEDANANVVTYTFDDRGNRASRTATDDSATARTESWTWQLDDQVASHTMAPPRVGGSSMTTSYAYDDYGNLETITDPTGRVETRTYYGTGDVKTRTWTKTGLPTLTSTNWVNTRGWITKMRDAKTGTTDRDTTYTYSRAGDRLTTTDPTGALAHQWDLVGNVTKLVYVDGARAYSTHTPTGLISDFSVAASSTSTPLPFASYTYDDDGLQTNEYLAAAGGNTRDNTRNAAGQSILFSEVMKRPDGTWETYTADQTYRADGRLGTEAVNAAATATMSYDDAGQLTGQSGPNPVTYAYGTRGNRLTKTVGSATTSYTANPNASIASSAAGTTTVDYAYDDAGRRTSATTKVSGTTTTTDYDARGKPATITTTAGSATTVEERTYDGDGSLTRATYNDGTGTVALDQTWDTTQAVPQLADVRYAGFLLFRADYSNERIAWHINAWTNPLWYKLDARGSVIAPDSNANAVVGATTYDPYGVATGLPLYWNLAYRSEIQLGQTIHLRNRDYDPDAGQFVSQDPVDGADGSVALSNSYHYATNDPYNSSDPLGTRPTDDPNPCGPGAYPVSVPPDTGSYLGGVYDPTACVSDPVDLPRDGIEECPGGRWSEAWIRYVIRVSVRVEMGPDWAALPGVDYNTLEVEPSGPGRFFARTPGSGAWRQTWACAKKALAEVKPHGVTAREGVYHSQYACHAQGSVGVPTTSHWAGGEVWELEAYRSESWEPDDWFDPIGVQLGDPHPCNWKY